MSSNTTGAAPQPGARRSLFFFKARPLLFVVVVLIVVATAFALKMRRDGIFACPANRYGNGHYLAHCEATAYGDFDHGAIWFALEPAATEAAAAADVLFLGNSRVQFGFSAPALGQWFGAIDRHYYLLGFSHGETVTFVRPLLDRLQPRARAYVINVDGFFADQETGPGGDVMHSGDARSRYVVKRTWQTPHRTLCGLVPRLCGNNLSFYRNRETGEWQLGGNRGAVPSGIGAVPPADMARVAKEKAVADRFLASLGVSRECVFFTYIPNDRGNDRASAAALATALGQELISPQLDGLRTFDGSHLDPDSAERFVGAVLDIAGPRLERCLAQQDSRAPTGSRTNAKALAS